MDDCFTVKDNPHSIDRLNALPNPRKIQRLPDKVRNWNFCWLCGNLFDSTGSKSLPNHQLLSTTPNTDAVVRSSLKPKKRKQNKKEWQVELIQVNGTSSSNKKATAKSLTSKRLSDFLDDSNKALTEIPSNCADSNTTFEKYSIINLEPVLFGSDETLDEAPLLFVGKNSAVNLTQNIQGIIESLKDFKEIGLIDHKDAEDQFSSHLDKEELSMIEELDPIEEELKPVKKVKKSKKKKQEVVQPGDSAHKQKNEVEYKSKFHKTMEDEHSARLKSLSINLAAFVEVCTENNITNRGLQCLLFYRKKYKQYKLGIDLYNMVLGGFAENGNLPKITEVLGILKTDNIECNAQSYAAIFECLGRMGESDDNFKILRKFHNEATRNGVSLNDIVNYSTFTGDKRDIVVKVIQRIDPEFQPIYTPPELKYKNCLLDSLDRNVQPIGGKDFPQSGSEILNEKRNFKLEEYQQMFNEQLQVELNGTVKIKSIEKFTNEDANVLLYRTKIEDLRKQWHSAICDGFNRDLKTLRLKSHCKGRGTISIIPYIRLLKVEKYADILLEEVRTLAEGSETFSQSLKMLYSQIGRKVQDRYYMDRKTHNGVLDKTKEIYDQYYQTLCEGRSSDNSRQMWQRLVHHNRTSGASMDIVDNTWPLQILIDVGRFLYQILLRDVKIDTNIMRSNSKKSVYLPAFYTIFRTESKFIREEVKPHPVLSKLYRASQQETLTFDANSVPMLCPPQPWSSPNNGGYILARSDFIRLPSQAFQQWHRIKTSDTASLYPSLDSLNQLASVAWKVDTKVLDVVLEVFQNGGSQELGVSQPPSALSPLEFEKTENDPTLAKKEKYEMFKAKMSHRRTQGEMFSLWCDTLYRLSLANHYRDKIFWLPHNMDFRGRVYPIPPHLNHLGSDLARSLLVFHQSKPLGVDGLSWLKLHCINLTGHKKRDSVQNRLLYAEEMLDNIIDSAEKPLTGRMWWVKSDEPWQTLATCMEIANVMKSPDPTKFMSSFPIHQDGSCNGLQHYAALGRDTAGAYSVNLRPASVPQDVYSDVAELVEKLRKVDEEKGLPIAKVLKGYVQRKVIKQTVMTTVYGVTRFGARQQIAKQLKAIDSFPKESVWSASSYLTMKTFESLAEMFTSTKEIQDWLTDCARLIASIGGQNVEWITPLGLPVVQPYNQDKSGLKKSPTTSVKMDLFSKPNVMKQKNAFPPNFIHSLDSTHMMLTSVHCERAGFTFMSVHDCYWTHACTVPEMNKICREQFVALHSQPILENLSKFLAEKYCYSDNDFQNDGSNLDEKKRNLNNVLRHVPRRGDLDLKDVLDSVYFFS